MKGMEAFFVALAGVLIAFLCGRHSQKKDDKAKIAKSEKKADIAVKVSEVTAQTSHEKGRIEAEYDLKEREIEKAEGDVDALGRIAAAQAQRAIAKGASEEER